MSWHCRVYFNCCLELPPTDARWPHSFNSIGNRKYHVSPDIELFPDFIWMIFFKNAVFSIAFWLIKTRATVANDKAKNDRFQPNKEKKCTILAKFSESYIQALDTVCVWSHLNISFKTSCRDLQTLHMLAWVHWLCGSDREA